MPMFVVHVGHVRMRVLEPAMFVGMRMWFSWRVFGTVLMQVVLVMHV